MSIFAFRRITVAPGFMRSICSLRAVKTMVPVSSPTRHSAMRVGRGLREADLPFCKTVLALTTLTVNVWPEVPGLSWSTLMNTGFLLAAVALALALPLPLPVPVAAGAAVAIDG
uniref:Uncharacterized protein n=1 Tax=Opuntia streptacantha TaxID=393608 RepID=A0A7C8ZK96_OPUST